MEKEKRPDFQKIAGSRQIVIKTAADLAAAASLDPAHWAVIGMPLDSVVFDKDFLTLLDTDGNNRIRPEELRGAILWLLGMLSDPSGIESASETLKLSAVNPEADGAESILASAKIILRNLGTPNAGEIALEQVLDRNNLVLNSCGNGDGVITSENNGNALLADFIRDAIAVCGSVPDITGLAGINLDIAKKFQSELETYCRWSAGERDPRMIPFGENTGDFYEKYIVAEPLLNHYFELCHAVSGGVPDRFSGLIQMDPLNNRQMADFLENAPCARPVPECVLSLEGWVNPLKGGCLAPLISAAHERNLCASEVCLTEREWKEIVRIFSPRKEWLSAKPAGAVGTIPFERASGYLEHRTFDDAEALIAADASVKKEIDAYASLRKLIILQSRILEFVNNFINLSALFNPKKPSLVQPGYLILDGRHYTLSCRIADVAAHKKIVERSNICVIYVALTTGTPGAVRNQTLAVAVTAGTMRDLFIGRTGVFIEKNGTEWDAKIIDFIQQPVSLWEAIQMPFYRFGEFLGKQADRFFSSKSKAVETSLSSDLSSGKVPSEIAKTASKQTPAVSGSMMLMGGGVGLAALGSAFALIVNSLKSIPVWNVLLVLIGIILIFSGPMMLVSIVKLCRRHVSDFLAASGWAVNPKMRLSNKMGMIFTHTPKLPAGSRFLGGDIVAAFAKGYSDKRSFRRKILYWTLFVLILIWGALMIWLRWCGANGNCFY